MSYINFIISRINYLPYYIPLVIEAKSRNIASNFFLYNSDKKFISPYTPQHLKELKKLANQYDIKLYDVSRLIDFPAITFFCEGDIVGRQRKDEPSVNFKYITEGHRKISLVCNFEYVMFYDNYVNNVDNVIMLHKFWAEKYHKINAKNLYLGSPKYDMKYFNMGQSVEERQAYLTNKYKINLKHKYILVMFPKNPVKHHKKNTLYPTKKVLVEIYNAIREMGYGIIVKSRSQDPVNDPVLRGDYYFEDIDFYPCNSMELIEIAHMVIYFSSSVNEECVALKTPYIDLKVDLTKDRFDNLNDIRYGICWSYDHLVRNSIKQRIKKFIDYLQKNHYQPNVIDKKLLFNNYYTSFIWNGGNDSSKRIIDWVCKKYSIKNELSNAINNESK